MSSATLYRVLAPRLAAQSQFQAHVSPSVTNGLWSKQRLAIQDSQCLRPLSTIRAALCSSNKPHIGTHKVSQDAIGSQRQQVSYASLADRWRRLSTSHSARQTQQPRKHGVGDSNVAREITNAEEEAEVATSERAFEPSDRAAQAAQVNLSAKLAQKDGNGTKATWAELRRLLRVAKPESKWLAVAFFLLTTYSLVTMAIPWSMGKMLDVATKNQDEVQLFGLTPTQFLCTLAAVLTLGAAANYGSTLQLRVISERVVARLRSRLYRHTFAQDAEFFDANRVGDLISRLNSDTVVVGKSITQSLSGGVSSFLTSATGFGVMLWTSPQLTGLLLLMVPPAAIAAAFYGNAIRTITIATQKSLGGLTKIVNERLGNVKTSQAFVGEGQEVGRYNKQVRSLFALGRKEGQINATFFASTSWIGDLAVLALLTVGGSFVRSGAISVGDLTSFTLYTIFTGSGLYGLSGFYSELMKGVGAASRLFELQDKRPGIHQTSGQPVRSAKGMIRFDNVSFAYPTRPAVPIFDGLDFTIPSGSNVCVVSPSGGGKSTIASLLLRFYNPTSGLITIEGVDIKRMNAKSLRRRIGVVAQEPVLFSSSIAENIAYGNPKASHAEIVAAARKANCHFVSDLPDGLDTQVGSRGSQLSGGQKQRIAIARALLKEPDILILDEATSALDAESETLVNEALGELLRGRTTTISIAHRLSTIKRSDWIIVLGSDGRVAEIGRYEELAADTESAFCRLMKRQIDGDAAQPSVP